MQRLFRILDTKTQKFEQDRFENKMEAKKHRNDLNGKAKSESRFIINRAEDHIYGVSQK